MSASLAEEGADTDKLMARMDELQTRIDAANGWEIERTLQRATDALRCPPGLVLLNTHGPHADDANSDAAPLELSLAAPWLPPLWLSHEQSQVDTRSACADDEQIKMQWLAHDGSLGLPQGMRLSKISAVVSVAVSPSPEPCSRRQMCSLQTNPRCDSLTMLHNALCWAVTHADAMIEPKPTEPAFAALHRH